MSEPPFSNTLNIGSELLKTSEKLHGHSHKVSKSAAAYHHLLPNKSSGLITLMQNCSVQKSIQGSDECGGEVVNRIKQRRACCSKKLTTILEQDVENDESIRHRDAAQKFSFAKNKKTTFTKICSEKQMDVYRDVHIPLSTKDSLPLKLKKLCSRSTVREASVSLYKTNMDLSVDKTCGKNEILKCESETCRSLATCDNVNFNMNDGIRKKDSVKRKGYLKRKKSKSVSTISNSRLEPTTSNAHTDADTSDPPEQSTSLVIIRNSSEPPSRDNELQDKDSEPTLNSTGSEYTRADPSITLADDDFLLDFSWSDENIVPSQETDLFLPKSSNKPDISSVESAEDSHKEQQETCGCEADINFPGTSHSNNNNSHPVEENHKSAFVVLDNFHQK